MAVWTTYDVDSGGGNREDLIDIITNVDPTDTPFFSMIGKVPAKATQHDWLTDVLAATATGGALEGGAFSEDTLVAPVRVANFCQILKKQVLVSGTQEAVHMAGRTSELAYQKAKKLKELSRDIEATLIGAASAPGATGTARTMDGLLAQITTNVETGSGTGTEALTETMYNDMLQTIWTAGGNPDVTFANGFNKRQISAFSTPSQRNIDAASGKLFASVSVYDSDFGLQRIVANRWMDSDKVTCIQSDLWKLAMLRSLKFEMLSKDGDRTRGQIVFEGTLEGRNEKGSGKITELTTS